MKKLLFPVLCVLMASFTACGPNEPDDNTSGESIAPVDLGLSVKWANMNIGATAPEACGNYYAWGEVTPKSDYSWSTYKYCNGTEHSMTKYCTDSYYGTVDNKTTLEPADDAAHVNWGGNWRMPTDAECCELIENCTWTLSTQNGVEGCLVTASNGNSIFLPAASFRMDTDLEEPYNCILGRYRSSSTEGLGSGTLGISFSTEKGFSVGMYDGSRIQGWPVRPVCP